MGIQVQKDIFYHLLHFLSYPSSQLFHWELLELLGTKNLL